MSWRGAIKGPATFRGVPFFVEVAELEGGRRTVRHEYPLRDEPFSEDMGRRARFFPVDGYVLGPDYLAARDRLIEALEAAGPGELVHPYHGRRSVIAARFRVRESTADGGIARFGIDFEETPAQPAFPAAVVDAPAEAGRAAGLVRASVGQEFLAAYRPGALTASLADVLRAATLSIENALLVTSMMMEEAAALRRRVDRLVSSATTLVHRPADMLAAIAELVEGATSRAAMVAAYPFDPGQRPPATTSTRVQERANWDALARVVRTLVATRAAELAVEEAFDSYDAAVAARDGIAELLDEQAELAGDEGYAALVQLRAQLVRAVPGAESDLPRLIRYTPAETTPSLVLAHRFYGDLAREADLVARNRLAHPGFVVGGAELEVLSRAS